jgi:hypothetical protein
VQGERHLFFLLNHPIRYVSVTGPIVAIEEIPNKFVLLTIDDGSGATVQVKIKLLRATTSDDISPVDKPSNTTVSNVNVYSAPGTFSVEIDGTALDVGTVIRAKCTVSSFRGINQLDLQRTSIIPTTTKEALAWREVALWKSRILSKPWVISERQLRRLRESDVEAKEREAERMVRQRRRAQKELCRRREEDAKVEETRLAEQGVMDQGALV